jgi:hypothetical protein
VVKNINHPTTFSKSYDREVCLGCGPFIGRGVQDRVMQETLHKAAKPAIMARSRVFT